MKCFQLFLAGFFFLSAIGSAFGQESDAGQTYFTKKKCSRCHSSDDKKKSGPSLQVIANIFQTEEKLIAYFKGDIEPIVEPERAKIMKMRRKQLKKLSDQQQKELSQYIISFKE